MSMVLVAVWRRLAAAVLLACLGCGSAQAILDIEITQAMDGALPIAVVPMTWIGQNLPDTDVADIIRDDLARSGEFRTLSVPEMRQRPGRLEDVKFEHWRQLGVDSLIVGQVQEAADDNLRVTVELIDLFAHSALPATPEEKAKGRLFAKEFVVKKALLRPLGHHLSDLIYERLTGVRGAFATQIAYVTTEWQDNKPFRYRLQIADVDGHNPRPLLTSREPIMSPAWAPSGRELAYVSFENHRAEIYISDVVTGKRKRISAFPGINGAPAWSPDGKDLALVLSKDDHPKIYLLNLESGGLRQLTQGWSIDTEPRWMPDGKSLVFTSNRGGKPQIYQVDVDGSNMQRLTFTGNYNARPSVTPNGEAVVMIHRHSRAFHIAVLDLKSQETRILTETHLDESPTLSPNGRMVIYGTMLHNRRVLGAVSIDGRVKLQLPATDGDVQEPAWSPFLS